jgi:hypothetical protein
MADQAIIATTAAAVAAATAKHTAIRSSIVNPEAGSEDEADGDDVGFEAAAMGEFRTAPISRVHASTTAAAVACCEEWRLERWGLSHITVTSNPKHATWASEAWHAEANPPPAP